jgi:hypothetical protein
MWSGTVALGNAQQQSNFEFPKDGNGLLDYCGEVVNQLDSPLTRSDLENVRNVAEKKTKFAWCVGYIQATQDRIDAWQTYSGIEAVFNQQAGKPVPDYSKLLPDQDYLKICIPHEASIGQLARVIVKWLREHPEKLHELKSILVMEALQDAFSCPAQTKEAAKPTTAKPVPSKSDAKKP